MIDVITKKPLRVTINTSWPYIDVAACQIDDVHQLLEKQGIRHSVREEIISFNGGPEEGKIFLGRGVDPIAVQAILDSIQ